MKRYLFGCLLVLFLIAAFRPAAFASSRREREYGEDLFNANGCLHCHMMGKVGGHKGPDLSGVGRTAKASAITQSSWRPAGAEYFTPPPFEYTYSNASNSLTIGPSGIITSAR